MNLAIFPLVLLGVLFNSSAQLLLKAGMDRIGYFSFSFNNIWPITMQVATSPYIMLGIIAYVISLAVWLLVLSRTAVSIAYPMVSLGYIVNAVLAYYLLGENVTLMRLTGITIILFGVFIVARS